MKRCLLLALLAMAGAALAQDSESPPGLAVYKKYCASCHDQPAPETRAPSIAALRQMNAQTLLAALTQGVMKANAADISRIDRDTLVAYLAVPSAEQTAWIDKMRCSVGKRAVDLHPPPAMASFGGDPHSHRHLTAQQARLTNKDLSRLELKWALGFPQATQMRGGLVVIGSTVFIAVGQTSRVYALDTDSGCIKWTYASEAPFRAGVNYGELRGRKVLVGADAARVHVIDAQSGERVWVQEVKLFGPAISAAPVIYGDRVFVALSNAESGRSANEKFECCRSHGAVVALDANGKRLWVMHTMEGAIIQGVTSAGTTRWGPSGAPIWAHMTIDEKRNTLYVGTGDNFSLPTTDTSDAMLAVDIDTGKIKWKFQGTANDAWNGACGSEKWSANCPDSIRMDWDFGGPAILAQRRDGSDILLAGQKSGQLWALDPDTGKVIWMERFGHGTTLGGIEFGMASDGERVFAPINDSIRPNRFWKDPVPGVNALDIDTGKVIWRYVETPDCSGNRRERVPDCDKVYGISSPPLVIDKAVVTGAVDGRIRIFDAATGKILFTYDTVRDFTTINGVPGKGGRIDHGALAAGDGTLFVQSGYGRIPGNVLLAFRPRK